MLPVSCADAQRGAGFSVHCCCENVDLRRFWHRVIIIDTAKILKFVLAHLRSFLLESCGAHDSIKTPRKNRHI